MSTTSTAPTVIDAALAILGQADAPLFECWPGPEAKPEMIVLSKVEWDEYEIATIKAGRKQRQENYRVLFHIWVLGVEETSPANPKPARDRAFQILAGLEDALAVDVTGGTDYSTVQWDELRPREAEVREFERGWGYRIEAEFSIHARLL